MSDPPASSSHPQKSNEIRNPMLHGTFALRRDEWVTFETTTTQVRALLSTDKQTGDLLLPHNDGCTTSHRTNNPMCSKTREFERYYQVTLCWFIQGERVIGWVLVWPMVNCLTVTGTLDTRWSLGVCVGLKLSHHPVCWPCVFPRDSHAGRGM